MKKTISDTQAYLALIVLTMILLWISLFTGVQDIKFSELFTDSEKLIFFGVSRIPRTLALLLVGAGLSVCGFIMQQLSQNKFVSPTTAGTLDAAKMGILFGLILVPGGSLIARMSFSMLFTFLACLIFVMIVKRVRARNTVIIPLVGIMFGNIIGAVATFFAYKNNIVQNTQEWLLGDFSSVMEGQYETIYLILPAVLLAYIYAERFTIAGMGESFATNLGLSYNAIIIIGLLIVSLTVSATVVTVGSIPFVGLIIPNMVSLFVGDNLRRVLPFAALWGAVFLLSCDIIGRLVVFPYEIPIGMMVGVIGGAVFLVLILKRSK